MSQLYYTNSIVWIVNTSQNTFKIANFVIDEEKFPEQIPGEHWRYTFQQFVNKECILEFLFDIQIQRKNQLT
jgi:hypothetical protein